MANKLDNEIRNALERRLRENLPASDLRARIASAVEQREERPAWLAPLALTAGLLLVAGITFSLLHLRQRTVQLASSPTAIPSSSARPEPTATPSPVVQATASTETSAPLGYAVGYGWDGVDSRMRISFVVHDNRQDLSSWTFGGSSWSHVPSPAVGHAQTVGVLSYDSKRHVEVLVAVSYTTPETWEWNGIGWQRRTTDIAPEVNSQNTTGAYSPELGALVLFDSGQMRPSRTWLYDGKNWRSLATSHEPPGFFHIEYDQTRHEIIALSLTDYRTWTFDGHDWTPLPLLGSTPAIAAGAGRQAPAVALDQQRDQWVLFGGFDGTNSYDDTWTGDGTTWTQQSPAQSPTPRVGEPGTDNLAWDPLNRRLLLFGGQSSAFSGALGDTWAWNGVTWQKLG